MRSRTLHRIGAAAATVALAGAGMAVPAVASAKPSSSLSKKKVIALIKQYSKPGPRGAKGKDGTSGTQFTTPANSGLTLSNGALSANLGIGMGLDPSNNTIQVNTGAGLNESAGNLVQLNPSFGTWGVCPGAQVLTALSVAAPGSFTCHYPTFANVLGGGLNASTSNPLGTITVEDQNASGPGGETPLVSTVAPGATGVKTTYYLAGDAQFDDTSATTQTVFCSLMQGSNVIETGADTFGQGFAQVNIQAAYTATTGAALSLQCEDQTAQTFTKASGTIEALPLTQ
jgi:hypothetical protein